MEGFDCSGLVQAILRFAGIDPPSDQTAQALYDKFENTGDYNRWGAGSLSFYGKDTRHVIHVGYCVDKDRMIEAAGGGSKVLTIQDAIDARAYVKGSLIKSRKDFLICIRPKYVTLGLI